MTVETIRIKIEAPEATAAFMLEKRLAHLRASAVERYGTWNVELEPTSDRLDEVDAAIRHWLRELDRRSTAVWINGASHTVAVNGVEQPLGAGYDGGALEHEP